MRHISPGLSSGSALADIQAQFNLLAQLQRRISNADATSLQSIRSEVAASVAASQSAVQQAQTGAMSASVSAQAALSRASEDARRMTTNFVHDFYDRHEFDKYLKFTSANDEEEYRKREAERHAAIEEALAKRTSEGNLEANRLAIEQLKDAGMHGADRSPAYKPTLDRLTTSDADLQQQLDRRPGVQTDPPAKKDLASTDPAAALRAAGVSLADQNDATHSAPRGAASQRGRV